MEAIETGRTWRSVEHRVDRQGIFLRPPSRHLRSFGHLFETRGRVSFKPPPGYNPYWTPPPGYDPHWIPPPGYDPYAKPSGGGRPEPSVVPPADQYDIDGDVPVDPTEGPVPAPTWTQPVADNPEGLQTGNERKVSFVNDGTEPLHLKFTPNAGEEPMPDIVVPPGQGVTVQFPEGWSGNVRSTKGNGPATLVELTFDPDKTWADVSHIDGSNAAATIQNPDGTIKTGRMTNLLDRAPEHVIARDENGRAYGIRPSTVSEVIDQNVVDFLAGELPVGHGYKYPTDDLSTTAFPTSNLVVHMADYR